MLGKKKCKILREIRAQIASENDIPFVTEECRYKGDCKGTCPKCESELRYLEAQLEKRRAVGKAVTVSALALSLAAGMGGCGKTTVSGYIDVPEGDVPYVDTDTTAECVTTEGEIAATDDAPESELEGDVAYIPENEPEDTQTEAGCTDASADGERETASAEDGQN